MTHQAAAASEANPDVSVYPEIERNLDSPHAGGKRNGEGERRIYNHPTPPGVMDTKTPKKSQMKRSRPAPSSRRRPQIEAVINHASAEWNRTTAIDPEEVYAGLPRLSY